MPWKDKDKYKTERWKEFQRGYSNNWYHKNKQRVVAKNTERKIKMREFYQHIRDGLACADCGQTHPATLHFHHSNPAEKEFSIADFVRKGKSVEALKKEISKCIVLCANCHAIRHHNHNKGNLLGLGAAGELERWEEMFAISEEEEFSYCAYFGVTPSNVNPDPVEYAGTDGLW
jgi:hypothetical protein